MSKGWRKKGSPVQDHRLRSEKQCRFVCLRKEEEHESLELMRCPTRVLVRELGATETLPARESMRSQQQSYSDDSSFLLLRR